MQYELLYFILFIIIFASVVSIFDMKEGFSVFSQGNVSITPERNALDGTTDSTGTSSTTTTTTASNSSDVDIKLLNNMRFYSSVNRNEIVAIIDEVSKEETLRLLVNDTSGKNIDTIVYKNPRYTTNEFGRSKEYYGPTNSKMELIIQNRVATAVRLYKEYNITLYTSTQYTSILNEPPATNSNASTNANANTNTNTNTTSDSNSFFTVPSGYDNDNYILKTKVIPYIKPQTGYIKSSINDIASLLSDYNAVLSKSDISVNPFQNPVSSIKDLLANTNNPAALTNELLPKTIIDSIEKDIKKDPTKKNDTDWILNKIKKLFDSKKDKKNSKEKDSPYPNSVLLNDRNPSYVQNYKTTITNTPHIPADKRLPATTKYEQSYILETPISKEKKNKYKCPPCAPCGRCPDPAFQCKMVPNYNSTTANVPRPILNAFSTFGM